MPRDCLVWMILSSKTNSGLKEGGSLRLSRRASCHERLKGHILCALQMLLMISLQNSVAFTKSNFPCVSSNKVVVLSPN